MAVETWKNEPDDRDYPAAGDYLSLILDEASTAHLVDALRKAPLVHHKAKDLLRSSRLAQLPPDNIHVAKDLKKVAHGEMLSPVLLVRGRVADDVPLTIADGYHRVCASYHLDEDADIPCRLIDAPQR